MKFLVINGANLNLLGQRDPGKYGSLTLKQMELNLRNTFPDLEIDFYQSNLEGELAERIQNAISENYNGLIINPGGYAHTSVVIRDALELLKIPKIEVHLSNLADREPFRQVLLTASVCNGYISGLKYYGYISAIETLIRLSRENIDD